MEVGEDLLETWLMSRGKPSCLAPIANDDCFDSTGTKRSTATQERPDEAARVRVHDESHHPHIESIPGA